MNRQFVWAALTGGSIAGALDIAYAIIANSMKGVPAISILQSIAGGLLGRDTYSGGAQTAALGLALHFGIATAMATAFVAAYQASLTLQQRPVVAGVCYGIILFLIMNYAVVPLSRAYPGTPPTGVFWIGSLAAHIFLVGLPIALSARHWLKA